MRFSALRKTGKCPFDWLRAIRQDHMLLLGRKTSPERVAAFLLEKSRRVTAAGVMALRTDYMLT
jgi:hypothetical protein